MAWTSKLFFSDRILGEDPKMRRQTKTGNLRLRDQEVLHKLSVMPNKFIEKYSILCTVFRVDTDSAGIKLSYNETKSAAS